MKPYYDHNGITIYHGDCREILPTIKADVIVSDVPYGIALDTSSRCEHLSDHKPIHGDDVPFDPAHLLSMNLPTVLFGANHYASRLPDSRGWFCWDKATRDGLDLKQAEVEFGWTNFLTRPKMLRHMWSGAFRDSERGTRLHPAQKPVDLMSWVLSWTPPGCVLDPYMGAGPVLVAAKLEGRKAIGIEIEERYAEIAAKRLAQEVLPFV